MAYLRRDHRAIPFWRMVATAVGELREPAVAIAATTGRGVEAVSTAAVAGAGTAPGATLDSYGLSVPGDHAAFPRGWSPPVLTRAHEHRTMVDLIAVEATDDHVVAAALGAAVTP
jgi:hypothetical protein